MLSACTIVARNYLAHARVLADSFFEQHSDGRFTVLLIDDETREHDERAERFRCRRLGDIGFDRAEIGRLAAIYDVTELATAVKPMFLRHLLGESDHIIYLDPDTRVYGPLEKAACLARQHSIALTPHMTVPLPRDGRRIDDFHILSSGVYNLGFIALGPRSEPFVEWWWEKTRRDALVDHNRMMFTDQRWVDFVPGFFEHSLLKDPTYNVAYWNLHARELTCNGHGYEVNGQPLTFFHFSGFDVNKPYLLSKHQGDKPRILLSERSAVARICREYIESLERAGVAEVSTVPYGWNSLPSGLRFDARIRRLYRKGLEAHEKGRGPEPPDPFDPERTQDFLAWLNEPVTGGLRPRVSRYAEAIYRDRPDLQRAFPDLAGDDWTRYAEWLRHDGVAQFHIPEALLPPAHIAEGRDAPYAPPSRLQAGVNIAGYFRAELGIGEAARLLTSAVDAAGIPSSTLTYGATASRKAHAFEDRGNGRAPFDINIICVNADRTPDFIRDAGRAFLDGRYNVGYWFWELEHFPAIMHPGFDYVDEVWAATDFVTHAVRTIGRRPVYTIPLPIPVPICSPDVTRESLRLPSSFMFLFIFDFFSIVERKNPLGLIRAFARAFRPGEGPVLVIKTINGDARLNDLEKVRAAAEGRPDVLIVDEYYSAEQKNSLLGLCDCYVSLHRSEGFGLTIAEAMGLEKPVIATAYSGNLDFMTPENSYLVNYVKTQVGKECDPYPQSSAWAEPDLDQAAHLMRRVYEAREEAARKARQARQDILTKHTMERTAKVVERRLDDIRRARSNEGAAIPASQIAAISGEAHTSLTATLDSIAAQLTPEPSVAPGKPFRGALLLAQRLLFKVLRPYWWHQRHLQGAIVAAVRDAVQLAAQAARAEPAQREALQAVWSAVHALEAGTVTFQANAAQHLENLTDQLGQVNTSGFLRLQHRLYAPPFMAEPNPFHHVDAQGRKVLGFQKRRDGVQGVYSGFEDVFRGPEALIAQRQRVYLPILAAHGSVVDIGCGRGELLDLLREAGVPAVGVDNDASMVQRCRTKGHAVEQRDGIEYLKARPDDSVPAVFAAQVVEHLPYDVLLSFLEVSRSKLRAGGQLIFETVNPHSLEAFKTFYTDLTHQRPIFPEVAVALCWLTGFDEAYVFYPNGQGDIEQDRKTQGEYAVVATKA